MRHCRDVTYNGPAPMRARCWSTGGTRDILAAESLSPPSEPQFRRRQFRNPAASCRFADQAGFSSLLWALYISLCHLLLNKSLKGFLPPVLSPLLPTRPSHIIKSKFFGGVCLCKGWLLTFFNSGRRGDKSLRYVSTNHRHQHTAASTVVLTRTEVLGITSGSSKAEIKKAYHKVRYLRSSSDHKPLIHTCRPHYQTIQTK